MFTIIIQEKGGEQRRMVFNKPEVTIGRVQGNDIVLPKGNVSKRHARIVLKDAKFIIVDLKSTNGTYVNGRKITSPLVVKDSDKIYIGDFIVGVDEAGGGEASESQSEPTTSPPPGDRLPPTPAEMRPPRPTEAQPIPPNMMPGHMGATMAPNLGHGPGMGPGPGMAPNMGQGMAPNMGQGPGMGPGPGMGAPPMGMGAPNQMAAPMGPPMGQPMQPPMGQPMQPPMGQPMQPPPMGPGPNGPSGPGMAAEPISAPQPVATPPRGPQRPPPRGPGEAPGREAGSNPMPPLSPPPDRSQRPLRPGGGTMPPPIAPIPAPVAPAPAPTHAEPAPMTIPSAAPVAPSGPALQAAPMPAPAQVVPLADKAKPRLVGVATKRSVRSSVSMPSRRGVQLEPLDPKVVKMLDLQSNILERLRQKLDLDKIPLDRLHEDDLWQRAERATIDLVETLETSGELPKYIDQDTLIKETLSEALALGPLEELLADEKVDEIIIDRRDRVVVGKAGQLRGSGKAFSSDDVFERVVKRLVAEAGAVIDEQHPVIDLRMRDGTRVTAAVSPVAARGACLMLKKAPPQMAQLPELVAQGVLSTGMADFLTTCVSARRNVLVCGGPGSGKTAVLGAIAAAAPAGERVVSIEEIAELAIPRDEWIQLETRAGSGKLPSVDLAHLLDTAMRLQPDRLVVGEVRGREALPLVQALCTSLDGATVAMSGEGAHAALARLVTVVRVGAPGAHDSALRELVAQAFEIVVHVGRWTDGTPRVLSIEEVVGSTGEAFDTQLLFQFRDGAFLATGTVPRFYGELEARGIPADQAVFR